MSLKDYSLEVLEKEIELRKKEAEKTRKLALAKVKLTENLTKEMIDLITPEHGQTTCCDDNIINGWSEIGCIPRCNRCALLQIWEKKTDFTDMGDYMLRVEWYIP